ncbi:MAG: efflux RND transporter permease subunit [Lentisphaerae bacterium]|nr:efflux RND transporter permease subunit [Lentisphaerota bacterium]
MNMFQGIALTAIALFLFLHSFRGTIIIALGMPAAVVATFILLYFAGYTINIMSMMGLAISIGILVNNAILVLENIHRHIDMGDDPKTAASKGTSEIAVAVASTTLTNIVVFLPIAFMESVVGQVFRQFAMTVVFATLFSLMTAFTLTPMLAATLLRKKEDSESGRGGWLQALYARWDGVYDSMSESYVRLVERIVQYPWTVVAISAVTFFVIVATVPRLIGGEFFPEVDEGVFVVNVETDVASSLDYTDTTARKVEKICSGVPEVSVVYSTVGSASSSEMFGSSSAANVAQVVVKLTDKTERDRSTKEIMDSLRPILARMVGAKITLSAAEQGGPGGKPIELEVRGEDIETLKDITGAALTLFRGGTLDGKAYPAVPGLVDADTEWREGKPEVSLHPDRNSLRIHGVTIRDLAESIRAYYTGVVASRYREGDDEHDIRVQLSNDGRKDASILEELSVPATGGGLVRVSEVVTRERTSGPTQLTRKNREHMIKVVGETSGRTAGEVHGDLVERMGALRMPDGYSFDWAGEIELMKENFGDMNTAMLLAMVLTYLLLAGILESWKLSVLIMLSLPLSFAGVFVALLVRGLTINIFSLMGMVMLIGLVINNAIVIVDYAALLWKQGMPLKEAVPKACGVRLRPILMANTTTIIAMIPLSLGIGAGGEFRAPMAVTQMGGLLFGGLLALLVTPAIFYLSQKRADRKRTQAAAD